MKEIKEALTRLTRSKTFKDQLQQEPKLRVYRERIRAGDIGSGAAINLLSNFGYKITIADPDPGFKPKTKKHGKRKTN